MPSFGFSASAGILAVVVAALPVALSAQIADHRAGSLTPGVESGSFQIAQRGHAVGTASFRFTATQDGYRSTSLVKVAMQGLDYALSKAEQLSQANELEHVQLSATVNGQAVTVAAAPDAVQLLMNISSNGKSSTTHLAAHSGAVFLPDFDPGALQTLLALGAERNNRGLWAILPKNAGFIEPIELATYADQQGTLDGKAIMVHHIVATIAGAHTDLFSGPENQLLQAELPEAGFALVRKGFQLKPPAKPIVPVGGLGAPSATAK
ncbi:MAG: hypothetical protein WBP85_00085 [Terracidiphilus sp.]